MKAPISRFTKYAWSVLIYNIAVVMWGGYVRATGSGAGCGSHWPLCNGEIIPRPKMVETLVEFSHRLSSGLAFLLVVGLIVWASRQYSKGDPVRKAAGIAMGFMISESLVGASLVIFEWVAGNISAARVVVMGVHLLNTFVLLAAIAMTAWWSSGRKTFAQQPHPQYKLLLIIALAAVMVLSMAGAITALGDTLFPVESLAEGLEQDFSSQSHYLIRLRVWHPFIATIVGVYIYFATHFIYNKHQENITIKKLFRLVNGLFLLQLSAGLLNLLLLVPVWMQLVHLGLASTVWLALVLFTAAVFALSKESITTSN
ncbi:MAG: COX15/CtaA family protein [Chloroflexi bacterium]|nr:COX15/CtaA family protein [Chloroflexota bacterium]